MARRDTGRVALWALLVLACPGAVTAVFLRPALVVLAYTLGAAGVVVPAHLLVRDRPPWHRCPPRHARRGHAGTDADTKLRVADIERRLNARDEVWALAEKLRRGGQHARNFHVIDGGGGDDGPENGDSQAGLISWPASA